MTVAVVLEHRFDRDRSGRVWTTGPFPYSFWRRYLTAFDEVRPVARMRDVATPPGDAVRADGPGVAFAPVPCYVGPWQFLRSARRVMEALRKAIGPRESIILRIPSQLAMCLDPGLRRTGRPFGVEMVGDPRDALAPGTVRHPLRPVFRWWYEQGARRQCRWSRACCYVTQEALQRRYPPGPGAFEMGCSDVELPQEAFVAESRPTAWRRPLRLITVGSLAHLYKAQDVLIEALALCLRDHFAAWLTVLGGGRYRAALEARASRLGVREHVEFRGQVSAGGKVRQALDEADLFVLPSRQEGLPRALIEAMARGLPAIGSTVGGFPELLPVEDLTPPGDAEALAAKIREIAVNPLRMAAMSRRNLGKARQYAEHRLSERRVRYYRRLRSITQAWLDTGARSPEDFADVPAV